MIFAIEGAECVPSMMIKLYFGGIGLSLASVSAPPRLLVSLIMGGPLGVCLSGIEAIAICLYRMLHWMRLVYESKWLLGLDGLR